MFSVDEAESSDHRKKKNSSSQDCVRGMCVESTHPVMHMPCKKPRPQGVCLTPGRGKREKKINVEIVSSLEPSEGVQTVSVLELQVATFYKHSFILAKLIMICWYNYHTLMRQCVKSLLSSITLQWHC